MSDVKQELYNLIDLMSEEISYKVIAYIRYTLEVQKNKVPDRVTIKNKQDLIKKLEEGRKASESGKIYSIEKAISKIENKYFMKK
ncbi:MAG: hypothetical protein FWF46_08215 [Oscillospiraceae bacterium]|nr:hypothetical protein [Oscillospiraceae bacterium]